MVAVEERIESLLESEPDCNQLLQARQLLQEAGDEIRHLRKQLAAK